MTRRRRSRRAEGIARRAGALTLWSDPRTMDSDSEGSSKDGACSKLGILLHTNCLTSFQLEKYKRADFGRCPRVLCQSQPLLPVGLTDIPYEKSVKLYCGRCEDIYSPKSSRHGSIDGAYFGTSFPHLLFLVYPNLIPPKSGPIDVGPSMRGGEADPNRRSRRPRDDQDLPSESLGEGISTASVALKADRYRPRIFGFQVHEIAKLQRWQEAVRDRCVFIPLRKSIPFSRRFHCIKQASGET